MSEEVDILEDEFKKAAHGPYFPKVRDEVNHTSKYDKVQLRDDGFPMYRDPYISARMAPPELTSWGKNFCRHIAASGDPAYAYVTPTAAYQSKSLLGLIWLLVKSKFKTSPFKKKTWRLTADHLTYGRRTR